MTLRVSHFFEADRLGGTPAKRFFFILFNCTFPHSGDQPRNDKKPTSALGNYDTKLGQPSKANYEAMQWMRNLRDSDQTSGQAQCYGSHVGSLLLLVVVI